MRRLPRPAAVFGIALTLMTLARPATAARAAASFISIPRGYFVASSEVVADGLTHVQLISLAPRRVVNVAFLSRSSPVRLRAVVSNERIAGGTETVRSMCARLGCLIAVNGDFFSTGSAQPAGGLASAGELLRTPPSTRWNITQAGDGTTSVRHETTAVRFFAHRGAETVPVYVNGLNVSRGAGRIALYTSRWAPSTQTGSGFEITMQPQAAGDRATFGQTLHVKMVSGFAAGGSIIPRDGFVLSAAPPYASLLQQLWKDVLSGRASSDAEITVATAPPVQTFMGGAPRLLAGGRQAFSDNRSALYASHTARTLAGRTPAGDAIIATVDGGSWSTGMTMIESMRFMRSLGASDALNLDGGGSATFVKRGWLVSEPSTGRERGVATALAFVAE